MEARTAWHLYTGSTLGTLVFILIAAGVAVLLWRRRRSHAKHEQNLVDDKIEMNAKTTTPSKRKEKGEYSLVSKAEPYAIKV